MATTLGKLVLQLGIEAGDLSALDKFEDKAKDAAKGADEAAKKTERFGQSSLKLRDFLERASRGLMRFKIHAAIVVAALTALTIRASMLAQQLTRFSLTTGLSAKELEKWQQQASLSGVAADEFKDSMVGLQRAATEVMMGGGNRAPFAFLQIQPTTNAFKMWEQLMQRAQTMDPARFSMYASMLGLTENMIALAREAKNLGPVDESLLLTDDDMKRLKEFNIYFNRTWDNVKRIGNKIGALMSPIATWVMWVFERLARGGKHLAEIGHKIWGAMGPLKGAILALVPLFAAWFPWTTAIVAAVVALEDFLTFMRGGKSIVGAVIGWFSDWRRMLQDIVIFLATIVDLTESIVGAKLLSYLYHKAKGTEYAGGLGEGIMDMATKMGAFDSYGESPIATMRDGKLTLIDKKGNPINVNVTNNISGQSAPRTAAKETTKAIKGAMGQIPVPQGKAYGKVTP